MPRHLRLYPLLLFGLFMTCTDPVVPEYDFEEGFLLVEGRLTEAAGASRLTVSRSEVIADLYALLPETGATVVVSDETGATVMFTETAAGTYAAPADFAVQPGRRYTAELVTTAGERVRSAPELTPPAVAIEALDVRFEQEAYFDADRDRFIPAYTLLADFTDPAGQRNFYRWRTTLFQQIEICATCVRGIYRNGECLRTGGQDYDYLCDAPCWGISQPTELFTFDDATADGSTVRDYPVARVEFSRRGGLLAVVEQQGVTAGANAYDEARADLTQNSGGLNAPLPAPLVGNLSGTDADGNSLIVLGYVGVSVTTEARLFIDRDATDGVPSRPPRIPVPEQVLPSPPRAPCDGPARTYEEPVGWQQ